MHRQPKQKSLVPTSKVTAVGAAGAFAIIIVWVAQLFGLDVPSEVSAACTTVITFAVGWFKTEKRPV